MIPNTEDFKLELKVLGLDDKSIDHLLTEVERMNTEQKKLAFAKIKFKQLSPTKRGERLQELQISEDPEDKMLLDHLKSWIAKQKIYYIKPK